MNDKVIDLTLTPDEFKAKASALAKVLVERVAVHTHEQSLLYGPFDFSYEQQARVNIAALLEAAAIVTLQSHIYRSGEVY